MLLLKYSESQTWASVYLFVQENHDMEWIPAEKGTHLPNPANQDKKDEIKASNITGRKII